MTFERELGSTDDAREITEHLDTAFPINSEYPIILVNNIAQALSAIAIINHAQIAFTDEGDVNISIQASRENGDERFDNSMTVSMELFALEEAMAEVCSNMITDVALSLIQLLIESKGYPDDHFRVSCLAQTLRGISETITSLGLSNREAQRLANRASVIADAQEYMRENDKTAEESPLQELVRDEALAALGTALRSVITDFTDENGQYTTHNVLVGFVPTGAHVPAKSKQ